MDRTRCHVAYVVSGVEGGMDAFIHREITALQSQGVDIDLFFTRYRHCPIYGPEKLGWKWHSVRLYGTPAAVTRTLCTSIARSDLASFAIGHGAMREFVLACYFAPIMKRENVAHIHCHFGDRKLTVGYFCAELLNLSLSVTIHAHEIHANPNPPVFRHALKRCTRVFAVSDYARTKLLQEFGVSESSVVTNRLFVDCDKFDHNRSTVTVLMVARFDERKGHRYLLDAARLLRGENIRFIIIGYGPLDIRQMVAEYGLEDSVIVFDKMSQEELLFFYSKADIFCLPSTEHTETGPEGIPVVLMEAMAAGLPVITTATGGTTELVEEILVPQEDAPALAASIARLANDSDGRHRMGEKNRGIVRRLHSPENIDMLLRVFGANARS